MRITHFTYSLSVEDAKVGVIIDGCEFARLDLRCAVHKTVDGERVTDCEETAPTLVSSTEKEFETVLVFKGKSSLWEEKTYTLTADPLRFYITVSVKGEGCVDAVEYFAGNAAKEFHGSAFEFNRGFTPCNCFYDTEEQNFRAAVPCHRKVVFMTPPMHFYSMECERISRKMVLGAVAKPGEHNFTDFDYLTVTTRKDGSAFSLLAPFDGHTQVRGEWTAPAIIGYSAEDDIDGANKYCEYYFSSKIAKPKVNAPIPKFWHGPIACGWQEQSALNDGGDIFDLANEDFYSKYYSDLLSLDLKPRCFIIDAKWQSEFGTNIADPKKWRDFRGFIDRLHAEGVHLMVWFKSFDCEGLPECVKIKEDSGALRTDVSHPEYLRLLDEMLYRIFSSDKGCYDCDGIKIDFAHDFPRGRNFKTYSGKYGVEYLYDFFLHIYNTVKSIKPHAIVNHSACHPYFAHICDQGRLHDYNYANHYCKEDMTLRAKLFSAALPNTLLDTDNSGFNTRRDTMRWQLDQHTVGIPDIYAVHFESFCEVSRDDLAAIAQVWREYTARIDGMYEE